MGAESAASSLPLRQGPAESGRMCGILSRWPPIPGERVPRLVGADDPLLAGECFAYTIRRHPA